VTLAEARLIAKVDPAGEPGHFVVRSPAVGVADGLPAVGVYINPNQAFLWLHILNRRFPVRLPRNVGGVVSEQLVPDSSTPVGYGQPLLRISERAVMGRQQTSEERDASTADADVIAVPAPSDGVFYRRPSPDSPPYVDEGSAVAKGSVLGLVEVMKSFGQIIYGGPDLPERGTVTRVLVEDGAEVAFGQTLFLVKPA